jgi:hypothetical protein
LDKQLLYCALQVVDMHVLHADVGLSGTQNDELQLALHPLHAQ